MLMNVRNLTVLPSLLLWLMLITPVQAIKPSKWVHSTEADFAHGKTTQTVITNLNQIRLATGTTTLVELPDPLTLVNDLAKLGEQILIAAGPQAMVLSLDGDKLDTLLSLPDHQIFTLAAYGDQEVLVGVSGQPSRLMTVTVTGGTKTLVELATVRYIWDMLVVDGKVYLATGIQGRLLEVDLGKLEPAADGSEPAAVNPGPSTNPSFPTRSSRKITATKPGDPATTIQNTAPPAYPPACGRFIRLIKITCFVWASTDKNGCTPGRTPTAWSIA